mgnify:CR=1 FL=1
MKKWSNKKAEWLLVMLAASLTASAVWTIPAEEEKSKAIDQYIIVELEALSMPNFDAEEMKLSSESEQSTEETVEVESEPEVVLFSLQDSLDSEEYSVTGISVDEPIIAQLLEQTADYQNYDTIDLYDITSYQQTTDESYDFNLQIPEDADITLYQTVDGQLQESTLDVMCTEDEYNRLPLVSYQSETNHWLVFYLGAKQIDEAVSDSDTEDAVRETESAAESLEGKVENEKETDPAESSQEVAKVPESKEPSTKAPETKPTSTKAPETKPNQSKPTPSTAAPSTKAPETKAPETAAPTTTAHTHNWVAVTTTVHHDAVTSQVWKEDSAAWDETIVTKAAWDEQQLVQDAYDENKLVQDAYDEPVYEWVDICNRCGHVFLDPNEDINEHMAAGCWSSWHAEMMQTGSVHHDAVYQTVHHDAVYQTVHHDAETTVVHHDATGHYETVVTQAAWDETVVTGYTCSGCGATK